MDFAEQLTHRLKTFHCTRDLRALLKDPSRRRAERIEAVARTCLPRDIALSIEAGAMTWQDFDWPLVKIAAALWRKREWLAQF